MTHKGGTKWIDWPYSRIRTEIHTGNRGDVTAFLVQLEYNLNGRLDGQGDDEWEAVARFDHRPDEPHGHDIRDERLHMDIMRDGMKVDRKTGFPEVGVNKAPSLCKQSLRKHADRLVREFERWHGIQIQHQQ